MIVSCICKIIPKGIEEEWRETIVSKHFGYAYLIIDVAKWSMYTDAAGLKWTNSSGKFLTKLLPLPRHVPKVSLKIKIKNVYRAEFRTD